MIRLEKLHVHKLGNVVPDTLLHFSQQGALLLGKNGTGKTTLLNVIVAMLRSDWDSLLAMSEDSFELEYRLRFIDSEAGEHSLDVRMCSVPTRQPDDLALRLIGPQQHSFFEAFLRDQEGSLCLHVSTKDGKTALRDAQGTSYGRSVAVNAPANALTFGDDQGHHPYPPSMQLGIELYQLTEQLLRFDEASGVYDRLTSESAQPSPLVSFFRPDHVSTVAFRSAVLSKNTCRALRASFGSQPEAPEQLRFDTAQGDLPWLAEFLARTGIEKVTLTTELFSSKHSSEKTIAEYGPLAIRYVTKGRALRGNHLSFGEKRLFALLHLFDAQESIILADELVNGLHHEWIQHCIDLAETRQSFLSSQNPLLFDFMHFSSPQDAADRFIECTLDEAGRFLWRNMSLEDASEFYEVYESGIQHVSEILRTRGYW